LKIHIDDIHEGGMTVQAETNTSPWFKDLLIEVLGANKIKENDNGRLDIQLFKSGKNVTIIGGAILKFHPSCDRCLEVFQKQEQVPIHQVILPFREQAGKKKEDTEDEDIGYYKNDEIELGDIVKEYIILAQGMVNLCSKNCKGLCPKCGKNLNNGSCKCKMEKNERESPFAVLKKIPS